MSSVSLIPHEDLVQILSACEAVPISINGLPEEELRWLEGIQECGRELAIPEDQWADVALYFMKGGLKNVMMERRKHPAVFGNEHWDWQDFKRDLVAFYGKACKLSTSDFSLDMPKAWSSSMSLEDDKPASEWLDHVEASCQTRGIRQSDWPRIASHFLPKDLRLAMLERLRHLMLFGISEWTWDLFKRDLLTLYDDLTGSMKPEKLDRLVATLNPAPFYSGVPGDEVAQAWLTIIGQRSEELRVPKPYWPSVGIHFLSGDLKNIMRERQTELTRLGCSFWEWSHFETEFKNFVGVFTNILDNWEAASLLVYAGDSLVDDAKQWLASFETACRSSTSPLPELRWPEAALYFLRGDLRSSLEQNKIAKAQNGQEYTYTEFSADFLRISAQNRQAQLSMILHSWEDSGLPQINVQNRMYWLQQIAVGASQRKVPEDLYVDCAMYFLKGDPWSAMQERKRVVEASSEGGNSTWDWETFQNDLGKYLAEQEAASRPASRARPERSFTRDSSQEIVTAAKAKTMASSDSLPTTVKTVFGVHSWLRRVSSGR